MKNNGIEYFQSYMSGGDKEGEENSYMMQDWILFNINNWIEVWKIDKSRYMQDQLVQLPGLQINHQAGSGLTNKINNSNSNRSQIIT